MQKEKNVIVIGDANLDSEKWNVTNYRQYKLAKEMQSTLTSNGMKNMTIGSTFLSEPNRVDGNFIESALDHIYIQKELEGKVTVTKGKMSAIDYLPSVVDIKMSREDNTNQ
jgi:endonuclease/exonuclease/phosphatase family metal-dependent hydrolase